MALAPDFDESGLLYVDYTGKDAGAIHVAELRASGDTADPATLRNVLTIPHPTYPNHNGGQLQFGPDGYLYISTGDGGGGGDPARTRRTSAPCSARSCASTPGRGHPAYTVPAGQPVRRHGGACRDLEPTACATPGASPSTAQTGA